MTLKVSVIKNRPCKINEISLFEAYFKNRGSTSNQLPQLHNLTKSLSTSESSTDLVGLCKQSSLCNIVYDTSSPVF